MEAKWTVDDGYVGRSRPQHTEIDINDIAESCETLEGVEEAIIDWIQNDFEQRIRWQCSNMEELVAAVMKRREEISKES